MRNATRIHDKQESVPDCDLNAVVATRWANEKTSWARIVDLISQCNVKQAKPQYIYYGAMARTFSKTPHDLLTLISKRWEYLRLFVTHRPPFTKMTRVSKPTQLISLLRISKSNQISLGDN